MTDIIKIEEKEYGTLLQQQPELKGMIEIINKALPEISRAKNNFGKTQSQFMDNMLTVSHTTPLRNMRQILAEIERIQNALRENFFKQQETKVKIQMKQRELSTEMDHLKCELLQIKINKLCSALQAGEIYIAGAIRSLTNYTEQYNKLAEKVAEEQGVSEFSEIDFEAEEEKYHIQKAFEQGLCAARTRGGIIDEGNHIYFMQIGINGSSAQIDVFQHLEQEGKILQEEGFVDHQMVLDFLEAMSKKYKGCSKKYANWKGMDVKSENALIQPKLLK